MEGLFLVNKPQGISSRNCGEVLKKTFNLSKVGHVGTLDMEAEGLLLVLSNKATRLQNHLLNTKKIYDGFIKLGVTSSTDDVFGDLSLIESAQDKLSNLDKAEALKVISNQFSPKYLQMPPMVSAKKNFGESSYRIVRRGEIPKLNPKEVEVEFLELNFVENAKLYYKIEVSSGFYVRALARDIGDLLEVGGVTESIRRVSVGSFDINESLALEQARTTTISDALKSNFFISIPALVKTLGYAECPLREENDEIEFLNGNQASLVRLFNRQMCKNVSENRITILGKDGSPLGIVAFDSEIPKYDVVFTRANE